MNREGEPTRLDEKREGLGEGQVVWAALRSKKNLVGFKSRECI